MNSTGYVIVAYPAAAALYGLYLLWLRTQERSLERRGRDAAR